MTWQEGSVRPSFDESWRTWRYNAPRRQMIYGTCAEAIFGGLSDMLFRQNSDISCALLCIVGRNRNERRLLGYIYQLLTLDVAVPNLEAAGSHRRAQRGQAEGPSCRARHLPIDNLR